MTDDADFLKHLGDLATLKNAIGGYYHQDAFEIYTDNDAIWAAIRQDHGDQSELLASQISELLSRSDEEVLSLWDEHADFTFASTADLRKFLSNLAAHLISSQSTT